jgi:hypothetical protein
MIKITLRSVYVAGYWFFWFSVWKLSAFDIHFIPAAIGMTLFTILFSRIIFVGDEKKNDMDMDDEVFPWWMVYLIGMPVVGVCGIMLFWAMVLFTTVTFGKQAEEVSLLRTQTIVEDTQPLFSVKGRQVLIHGSMRGSVFAVRGSINSRQVYMLIIKKGDALTQVEVPVEGTLIKEDPTVDPRMVVVTTTSSCKIRMDQDPWTYHNTKMLFLRRRPVDCGTEEVVTVQRTIFIPPGSLVAEWDF